MLKVLSIFGTRPEAIKMAPVVLELRKRSEEIDSRVCVTSQHREMLDQVLKVFDIRPDVDLDLMLENQGLAAFTARALEALGEVLERTEPDVVLVQGDTTTALAGALAAFYQRIPVGHVEAGLRTGDRYRPFPEEIDRRLVGVLATYHFAPTRVAADALRAEGAENIFVTGNTVIDALFRVLSGRGGRDGSATPAVDASASTRRVILVTAHRRENFGRPLQNICGALRDIAERNPDVEIVYPVHPNPNVFEPVHERLGGQPRIHLTEPLPYPTFSRAMQQAYLILTDSGGIQEEAPSLHKPVLVLRTETERPEAVEAGTVKVVGIERQRIVQETERLLYDRDACRRMAEAANPYGDGHAAESIVNALLEIHRGAEQKVLA